MNDHRPLGTLQVDVDELWVYYESIGRAMPVGARPLVYEQGIPRLLELLDRFGARATFFVCGRDLPAQAEMVAEIARRGHEVANHSADHRNGFARLTPADLRADLAEAGARIGRAIGQPPVGFKAPGFSYNPALPAVLAELGYLYDSSILPTPYAALLRTTQRILSRGHVDPTHYGRTAFGLAPLRPWRLDAGSRLLGLPASPNRRAERPTSAQEKAGSRLWEASCTTVPLLRLPMHSTFALAAGRWLFDLGVALVRARRVPMNYLLHGADVVDAVTDPDLASYRFLTSPWEGRRPVYEHILKTLSAHYRLLPTQEFLCGG